MIVGWEVHTLDRGRAAFDSGAWADAFAGLTAADAQTPLEPEDLDRLSTAAFLIGDEDASVHARSRAHAGFLERGQHVQAARSAFWLAFDLAGVPDQQAQAAGWLARAQRLSRPSRSRAWSRAGCTAPLRGTAWPKGTSPRPRALHRGDGDRGTVRQSRPDGDGTARPGPHAAGAEQDSGRSLPPRRGHGCGERWRDRADRRGRGVCSVISACHDLFDLRRAQEWTRRSRAGAPRIPTRCPFVGSV